MAVQSSGQFHVSRPIHSNRSRPSAAGGRCTYRPRTASACACGRSSACAASRSSPPARRTGSTRPRPPRSAPRSRRAAWPLALAAGRAVAHPWDSWPRALRPSFCLGRSHGVQLHVGEELANPAQRPPAFTRHRHDHSGHSPPLQPQFDRTAPLTADRRRRRPVVSRWAVLGRSQSGRKDARSGRGARTRRSARHSHRRLLL